MALDVHIGGSLYTRSEYDAFHGRLVAQYVRDDGTQVTVMDFGRPPYIVPPADPDAAIKRERLPVAEGQKVHPLNAAFDVWKDEQREKRMLAFCAIVDERGPVPLRLAARLLRCTKPTLQNMVSQDPEQRIVLLGRDSRGNWYGYPGQQIPAGERDARNHTQAMRLYLQAHGPSLLKDMAEAFGADPNTLRIMATRRPDLFVFIEPKRRLPGQARYLDWQAP